MLLGETMTTDIYMQLFYVTSLLCFYNDLIDFHYKRSELQRTFAI